MPTVAITGVNGAVGRHLVRRLDDDEAVDRIVAISPTRPPAHEHPPKLEVVEADPAGDDVKAALHGVTALVVAQPDPDGVRRLLDAAAGAGVEQVVVVSSAVVYGAWPDNPVPLTEDAPLRPNPGFAVAVACAEVERLVADWRDDHPSARAAVLRPALVVSDTAEDELTVMLGRNPRVPVTDARPPAQFVHAADVAAAAAHAVDHGLDGTFNVAPDGWVSGDTAGALGLEGWTLPMPLRLAGVVRRTLRLRRPTDPYLAQPWVVANDRLKATGWTPAYSNEEAVVATRRGSWWRELSPKRKQELALGVSGGAAASVVAAVVVLLRRRTRR